MKQPAQIFKPGDLVVNTGPCAGLGWIWKVIGYEDQHYGDGYINRNLVRLRIIRPLNEHQFLGQDWKKISGWMVGTDALDYQNKFQLLSAPIQLGLFL